MYKIPTQSEVLDKDYRRSVDIERTSDSLNFSFLFSRCNAHNAKVAIVNRGEIVDSMDVQGKYVESATKFLGRMSEARSKGYLVDYVIKNWSSVHPNIYTAYDCSIEKQIQRPKSRLLDTNLVSVKPMSFWEKRKRFRGSRVLVINPVNYSYNPAELAVSEVGNYVEALRGTEKESASPITHLEAIQFVANHFSDNANLGLFENSLFKQHEWIFSIENRDGTEANGLKGKNKIIAKKSDAYLRFDERYFVIKTSPDREVMISFDSIKNNGNFKGTAFDEMKKILDRNGKIVINGVSFGRDALGKSLSDLFG